MFPIRDHNPSQRTPFVTYALIAINIVVFLSYWQYLDDPRVINAFFWRWAMVPQFVFDGAQLHTPITSMFLHGSFMHLAGNMLFLWVFGDNMEDAMGHMGFLAFYLFGGIVAGFSHAFADPSSVIPMVGASGAIAAVMGGYLLLYPKARVDVLFIFIVFFRIFPIPAWIVLGVWFGLQVFNGFTADLNTSGVAFWAHAGGFVAGVIMTAPLWLRLGATKFWERNDGHAPHPETEYKLSKSSIPRVTRRK
ncbi:rhomboid family intramembrane serine protease [Halocynthiibacter sp. C4]|uniref:rhomboid family intramembrane serine protease n=1 Tax=Halocynthiibacter sp. C4 TaxID=2992758 RepID=UPI00237BD48E|nr:rhomboid family intramembrane serine protease [Halocynthiibacter sp. C4]MDE0588979.1 rhomboid family intramembrane serine protease [Halocynthiibacter sp. C4]